MRIGDVSRRTGVPPATLRAWERRYGVLSPTRTAGGHRVYSPSDVARVRQLVTLVDSGMAVSLAADRLGRGGGEVAAKPATPEAQPLVEIVWSAADRFDEREVRGLLTEAEAALGLGPFLDDVVVPVLRRLGADWRASPRNIAREHFTSTLVRSYLVQLLGENVDRKGPIVVTAAPAGDSHDIGVIMVAVVLAAHGWHPITLGAQTPASSVDSLLAELAPPCIAVGGALRGPAARLLAGWAPPRDCLVVLGGAGFRPDDIQGLPRALHHDGPYGALPRAVADASGPPRRRPPGAFVG
jgi:DNA-binding transcriptional MerR regulator